MPHAQSLFRFAFRVFGLFYINTPYDPYDMNSIVPVMLHAYTFRSIVVGVNLSAMCFVSTCDMIHSSAYDA